MDINKFVTASMNTDTDNPYASPTSATSKSVRVTRWHIVAAAASFLIGIASFAFGLFAVGAMIYVLWTPQANRLIGDPNEMLFGMIAGCSMYLGFGTSWIVAGWYYWNRRYLRGLIATGIGILFPFAVFAILGF